MEYNLGNQIEALIKTSKKRLPEEIQAIFDKAIKELDQSVKIMGIKAGHMAPNFTLKNHLGDEVELQSVLEEGPVVLTFYRGAWCPYCNLQLKAYQNVLTKIEALGAKLIAISPQKPDDSLSIIEKHQLSFPVLSDMGLTVSKKYNIVYALPEYLQKAYKTLGLDLETLNGDGSWQLPFAATFIINQQGLICYAFIDADYKKRMEPIDIISILELLK
ncbi:peroxiredoxin-like family protein [Petrocella sp. FN5]|uniref:peroxiredoxin-like family protein n=1 Tax=Petrocella sp. FN5 TaxID=3032002 RepID=UPI0023D9B9AE|nr:peroxiredoxin-like family protein [Petrocella sp. FN5]MDF1618748.1 peroxiredoxin-like family protein [Petrocella sp. FN5]